MSARVAYLGTSIADWVGELSSSDPLQRRLGAYALGEIGPAATEAVSDLAAALQDPVGFVRVWAAAALARWRHQVESRSPSSSRSWATSLPSSAAWQLGTSDASVRPSRGSNKPSSPSDS